MVSNKRIPPISFKFSNFAIHNSFPCEVDGERRINEPLVKITERPYFFSASHMLGRTPSESMLVSKKLLALISNNLRTTGAIMVSVIKGPKTKNFLRTISDSTELSSESFKSKCLGVNLGTKKRFLRNHCWHLSNFSIKVGVTVSNSTPYSKEGRQACRQNLMYTKWLNFRRSKKVQISYLLFS